MAKLIENNTRLPDEGGRPPQFDIIVIPVDAIPKLRSQVPTKPALTPPVSVALDDPLPADEFEDFGIELTRPNISLEGTFESHRHGFNKADGDAQAIMLIEPRYPPTASRKKVSGYVIARFDVEIDGSTTNIEILEAQPADIFNAEAIRAIQKWKYRPKVEGGIAMKQKGLKVRLDFNAKK